MRLNPLFTTYFTVYVFISLVCCLKWQNNVLKCQIPAGRTIWSSRYVSNSLFSFWKPFSLLPIGERVG